MRSKYPPLVPVEGIGGGAASWLKSNVVFSSGASDGDSLEVSAVMRAALSVTLGLMVLMRLDLFFTGVPNLRPSKKISAVSSHRLFVFLQFSSEV